MSEDDGLKAMGQVIQIDEARIQDHFGEMVRGAVEETLPKLRRQTFETAAIERYRRPESSVEESLIEMYLAGISVLRR
jgi:putative transposase